MSRATLQFRTRARAIIDRPAILGIRSRFLGGAHSGSAAPTPAVAEAVAAFQNFHGAGFRASRPTSFRSNGERGGAADFP